MEDRLKSAALEPWSLYNNLRGVIDGRALMAIQQRNVEAMTRTTKMLTEAASLVGNKNFTIWKELAQMSAPSGPAEAGNAGFGAYVHGQATARRDIVEKAIKDMRVVNDVTRECCFDVASELVNCARDNWDRIETEMATARAERRAKPAAPASSPARQKTPVSA